MTALSQGDLVRLAKGSGWCEKLEVEENRALYTWQAVPYRAVPCLGGSLGAGACVPAPAHSAARGLFASGPGVLVR